MAETLVNGEARTAVKVLEAKLEACQQHCRGAEQNARHAEDLNRDDHSKLFGKLDELSAGLSDLRTSFREAAARYTVWGSLALIVASAVVQLVLKLIVK